MVFTGIKITEMLYHFNIFLFSSLIRESRVLCRYRRKGTLNLISLKVYFSRPFNIIIFASCDKLIFQIDQTDLRRWYSWLYWFPLCSGMYLDVSHPEQVGSLLTDFTWLSDRVMRAKHLQVSSDASTTRGSTQKQTYKCF